MNILETFYLLILLNIFSIKNPFAHLDVFYFTICIHIYIKYKNKNWIYGWLCVGQEAHYVICDKPGQQIFF